MTGNLYVSLQSKSAGRQAGIDDKDKEAGLRDWADLAHGGGSPLIAQLNHGGRQMVRSADPGQVPVSASAVREPLYGTKPRPLRRDEIPAVVETFAAAAARSQDVGFDGVQIHAAHGYLKVLEGEGVDAVEISRAHYESWPGMILGHHKGFISG